MVRLVLATIAVAAVVLVFGALVDGGAHRERATPHEPTGTLLHAVSAPRLTAHETDRQDRPDRRRQRAEALAFDRRPLLSVLPAVMQGVRFEIGGLDADGRTTIIRAHAGDGGSRRARIAFATLKRRVGDRSSSYRLAVVH